LIRPVVAAVALIGLTTLSTAPAMAARAPIVEVGPRVVIVVGPSGALTSLYRSIATRIAREARRWTGDVVDIETPRATWPAVRRALSGASIVVYLGHGNGWPSRYRGSLDPSTEDGLGLDPAAGADGTAHRYYGETYLAREIRLAPGAVVLLSHLCYASGNSEPGLPEGNRSVARQRIDNHAAGWIAAGAAAVIADTFGDPVAYLRPLLATAVPVERLWRAAPNAHRHVQTFASTRSAGFRVAMDPTGRASGFHRSLVWRADDVRGLALATLAMSSLGGPGFAFGAPSIASLEPRPSGLVIGSRARLTLPFTVPAGRAVPGPIGVQPRWDPLPTSGIGWGPAMTPTGAEEATSVEASKPTVAASIPGALQVDLVLPASPGTYVLTVTLSDVRATAFDAPTQRAIPPLTVRIVPPVAVAFDVIPAIDMEPGGSIRTSIRIANPGAVDWADPPDRRVPDQPAPRPALARRDPTARLIGHWLALTAWSAALPDDLALPLQVDPGTHQVVALDLVAPAVPGSYLLVLDVVSPLYGSLGAAGAELGSIRVIVGRGLLPGRLDQSPATRDRPGRQGRDAHRDQLAFGRRQSADGRQELIGPAAVDDPQDGVAARGQPE
jgi:hypothetical protein